MKVGRRHHGIGLYVCTKGVSRMAMVVGKVVLGASKGKPRAWLGTDDRLARALRENERLRQEIKELKKKLEDKRQ
jgi:hypothetical protein